MKKLSLSFVLLLGAGMLHAQSGQILAEQNGCMACHQIQGKKSAPAFRGVANRNLRFNGTDTKNAIMKSIREGSKGKYPQFANAQMPPYPNISDADLETLGDWILSQARRGGMGRGHGKGQGMGGF